MPSVSNAQQRLFGMVLAYKRGKLPNASDKIKKISEGISESSAEDFAKKARRKNLASSMVR